MRDGLRLALRLATGRHPEYRDERAAPPAPSSTMVGTSPHAVAVRVHRRHDQSATRWRSSRDCRSRAFCIAYRPTQYRCRDMQPLARWKRSDEMRAIRG